MTRSLLGRIEERVHRSRSASLLARSGLVARTGFYLLLAYLVLRILLLDPARPANASGALRTVAATPLGRLPVALAAVGFLAFGVSRLLGACRDTDASWTSRTTTGLQGVFFLALTSVPASFVLGSRSTGTEQQGRSTTGLLLRLPAGRVLVVCLGLVVILVCLWQVVTALRTGFTGSLRTERSPRWVRLLIRVTGRVGITMRALAVLPIGVFLIIAAFAADPNQAKGMDATLAALAEHPLGRVLLGIIAAGFFVFATYSLLEAGYRDVDAGD